MTDNRSMSPATEKPTHQNRSDKRALIVPAWRKDFTCIKNNQP